MRISRVILLLGVNFSLVFCCSGAQWDKERYIGIDEIKAGMEAYCLTCYQGTEIERFGLEVVDVVRGIEPGKNAILVRGTDERFIFTGPVSGCSGSPVYIEGRLAGALAFGWPYSKDALYGVTPIEEMLRVGTGSAGSVRKGVPLDMSAPIDFGAIEEQVNQSFMSRGTETAGFPALGYPLIASGFGEGVCRRLDDALGPLGFKVFAAAGGGQSSGESTELVPGAALAVPLVSGDVSLTAVGTVTEVIDGNVYAFGHQFLGYGPVDFPMATAKVHTVVTNMVRSFKLASTGETVGALCTDESTAIFGRIGQQAHTIPLTVTVQRYNDKEKRVYNCQVVNNEILTSVLAAAVIGGTGTMLGELPPQHTVEYKGTIRAKDFGAIEFENVSTGMELMQLVREVVGSVSLLMSNPYRQVEIESLNFDVKIIDKNILSHIWSAEVSDTRVKAGDDIEVSMVLEEYLGPRTKYGYTLTVPQTLSPGKYELTVCGEEEYKSFLRKNVPYKFIGADIKTLFESLGNSLGIKRNKLYCIFNLGQKGVVIERAELAELPETKAVVLQSPGRMLTVQPYQKWIEKSFDIGTIVINKEVIQITVEE